MIWCMLDDRTLADLAAKFRRFAENEAPKAPLYARLAQAVADDPAVLALAARARAGQPAPNLLFAAVQSHLLRTVRGLPLLRPVAVRSRCGIRPRLAKTRLPVIR